MFQCIGGTKICFSIAEKRARADVAIKLPHVICILYLNWVKFTPTVL